jgi:hypothetical protein
VVNNLKIVNVISAPAILALVEQLLKVKVEDEICMTYPDS